MSETEAIPPWDERLPAETAKAWDAFCVYRDMGTGRSIDKAARHSSAREKQHPEKQHQNSAETAPAGGQESTEGQKSGGRPAPRHWGEWAREFHWVDRVRAYDDHVAEQAERQSRAEHLARIAEHRDRRAKVFANVSKAANALLGKGLVRLQSLEPHEIEVKHLAGLLRAAVSVAESALNMEATALGIDELLKDLEDGEEHEESGEDTQAGD